MLNIVDDVTRECLGAIPDTSISGCRVARQRASNIGFSFSFSLLAIPTLRGKKGIG